MYKIDEFVIHMTGGICQIKDIAPIDLDGADKSKDYYLLVPLKTPGSKVYVPIDNDSAIRPVYTQEEAGKLLSDIPAIPETEIENEKQREIIYKTIIKSCNLRDLVGVLKNLSARKNKRMEEGKKNTATDEKYIKIAEENLVSELAFALGKEKAEVKEMVLNSITM